MSTREKGKEGNRDATTLAGELPIFLLGPDRDVEVSSENLQKAQKVGERQKRNAQQETTRPIKPTF